MVIDRLARIALILVTGILVVSCQPDRKQRSGQRGGQVELRYSFQSAAPQGGSSSQMTIDEFMEVDTADVRIEDNRDQPVTDDGPTEVAEVEAPLSECCPRFVVVGLGDGKRAQFLVVDLAGRRIHEQAIVSSGAETIIEWDLTSNGRKVRPGVYFASVRAGERRIEKRIHVVR